MAGHVEDRWWRDKVDPETGNLVLNAKGKPVQEKTPLHGKGMRYRVRYYTPEGKERSKSFPDKEKGKAEAFLTKQQHDVLSGEYRDVNAGKITFKEFAEKVRKGRSHDESTVATVTSRLEHHVFPFMGDKWLSSFDNDLIRDWLASLATKKDKKGDAKPPAASFRAQLFDLVSSILDVAVTDGRIRVNPCRDSSINRPRPNPTKVRPWPDSRLRAVSLALAEQFKPVVPLGAGLGLRQGEIFAFTLDDVDRERMLYHVNRQVVFVNGALKFKLPKGHKVRTVPLGKGVLEQLDAYAENHPATRLTLPWGEDDSRKAETVDLLMVHADGQLYTRHVFNTRVWRTAFSRAGLTYTEGQDGMHAMRHLYASHMLAQGVSIKELAAFLGHSSEAFTLKTYVHLMPDSYQRARIAVDTLFKPRKHAEPSTA
jgi:integrase